MAEGQIRGPGLVGNLDCTGQCRPGSCTVGKIVQFSTESSFFTEKRASSLPTPAEIRALNEASGNVDGRTFDRPPPVMIPVLGLAVKYGRNVTVLEARTQMEIRKQLQGRVPVPEVFGWAEDGGQGFIYMALVQGQTFWRDGVV